MTAATPAGRSVQFLKCWDCGDLLALKFLPTLRITREIKRRRVDENGDKLESPDCCGQ